MAYYPLSQITTNLYTNGGELFILSTGEPYVGYYYQLSTEKYFSGKTPQDLPSVELSSTSLQFPVFQNSYNPVLPYTKLSDDFDNRDYPKYAFITKFLPYYDPILPTQQDYQNGVFQRFFCKKVNEVQYIEINKNIFDQLIKKDPKIEFSLYFPFYLDWQLTGTKKQVEQVNRNITEAKIKNNKLYKFDEYLKFDFIKYYKYTELSNLYTSGGEFKTTNGQNYIGDYHIHDSKGPMVGKTHTVEPHGYLFPINEAISPQAINQQTNIKQNQSISSYNPTPMNMGGGYSGGGGGGY